MEDLRDLRKEKIHTRGMHMTTYAVDAETVLVEGVLRDERVRSAFSLAAGGKMLPPGVVHHMTIRILVRGPDLRIEGVDVEMSTVPTEDCRETRQTLQALVGRRIEPGFSEWVKKTLGGPRGCAHLNVLLLAMASAAVQGFWAHRAGRPVAMEEVEEAILDPRYLLDTCWLWRRDGPRVRDLGRKLGRNGPEGEGRG